MYTTHIITLKKIPYYYKCIFSLIILNQSTKKGTARRTVPYCRNVYEQPRNTWPIKGKEHL